MKPTECHLGSTLNEQHPTRTWIERPVRRERCVCRAGNAHGPPGNGDLIVEGDVSRHRDVRVVYLAVGGKRGER